MASIQVIGGKDLQSKLGNLVLALRTAEARAAFRAGAGVIRDEARVQAPVRKGTLRKAIISFSSNRPGQRTELAGWARVNLFSGRIKAPHGFLVSEGTKERTVTTKKALKFQGVGDMIFRRKVKGVKANPYFQRAIDTKGQRALDTTVQAMVAVLNKAASK